MIIALSWRNRRWRLVWHVRCRTANHLPITAPIGLQISFQPNMTIQASKSFEVICIWRAYLHHIPAIRSKGLYRNDLAKADVAECF